jgi:class 3 adenylate cyclase
MTEPADLPFVVVRAGASSEYRVPVPGRLFVGRECDGVAEFQKLAIPDELISRNHLEIRLEPDRSRAVVVDTSTNGTRLNGSRIERAVPVPLKSGDRLALGAVELEFRSLEFLDSGERDRRETFHEVHSAEMVMVVGDIANYSTIARHADLDALVRGVEALFDQLHVLLRSHRGTLSHYAGDAIFAVWELDSMPDAVDRGVTFALAAADEVRRLAPELSLMGPDGEPIEMGWGIVLGEAAFSSLSGGIATVLGDAVNFAFRLAAVAARGGRSEVVVTRAVAERLTAGFAVGPLERIQVKGRTRADTILEVRQLEAD